MKIILGVQNKSYSGHAQTHRRKDGRPIKPSLDRGVTTAQVAQILEDRYGVMAHFAESRKEKIRAWLIDAVRSELKNLLLGGALLHELPLQNVCEKIQWEFTQFLNNAEIESMGVPGVPTKAALAGVSARFKSGRGPRRPSLIDTALFGQSFRAWVEE